MSLSGFRYGIFLLALLILILAAGPVFAREAIPEKITGEVTLAGELLLPATAIVEKGAVLILDAGSRVKVSPGASIEVRGKLAIKGTAKEHVIIASDGTEMWGGITFSQGAEGKLQYLEITGANVGIGMIASKVTVDYTTVTGAEKGIHLIKEANVHVSGCTLKNNKIGLVVEMKSIGSVSGCILEKNEVGVGIGSGGITDLLNNRFTGNQIGVRVFQRFPGQIAGNLFEDNKVGVRLEQNGPDTVVEKNRFTASTEAAILALSYTSPTIRNNFIAGGKYGILAHQFSSPKILNNRIEKMEEAIHLNKKSTSIVSGNVITHSKVGLFLDFSSYPDASNNRFEDNELHVKLGRFQSTHWEASAGSKQIVMKTAAQVKSRNPRLAAAPEEFPESVNLTGNWWDEKTRSEMTQKGGMADIGTIYDGHDLPVVTYQGFGEEKYRLDKVVYLPLLKSPPQASGLKGWQGRKDELGF